MSRRRTPLPRALALLFALLAVCTGALTTVQTASAGDLWTFSCRLPTGASTSLGDWTLSSAGGAPLANDDCASNGTAALHLGRTAATDTSTWTGIGVTFPAGLTAVRATVTRAAKLYAGSSADVDGSPAVHMRSSTNAPWFGSGSSSEFECRYSAGCTDDTYGSLSAPNYHSFFDTPGTRWTGVVLGCMRESSAAGTCAAGAPERGTVRIEQLVLKANDPSKPVLSSARGALLSNATASGTQGLTVSATDQGSGVSGATVEVDSTVVHRFEPAASSACAELPGAASTGRDPAFTRLQPCPLATELSVDIDTTRFTNGTHRVTVRARDATGNVSEPVARDITVFNAPAATPAPTSAPTPLPSSPGLALGATPTPTPPPSAPNGRTGDRSTARLGHKGEPKELSTRFGKRPTVKGKLLDATGTPISGAQLDVLERLELPAGTWVKVGTAETDAAGSYSFKPTAGASRRLRFAYAPTSSSTAYSTTREVAVAVAASMTIDASPRTISSRGLVRLSGTVRLDGLPKGTTVEVQVKRVGGWQTVANRSTGQGGRWSFQHRLQKARNTSLSFRARLLPSPTVPAGASVSPVVKVRVR